MNGHLPAPAGVALEFIRRINSHDSGGLARLMTTDHAFVDSLGERRCGRESLTVAWDRYFAMFPDYRVEIERTFSEGHEVIVLGMARGTYSPGGVVSEGERWEMPAAWRAVIRDGRVALWQVYADNSIVVEIIARTKPR